MACVREPVVFQFQPEQDAVYRIRETEEARETTTTRAGIGLGRSGAMARMEVRRPAWRWALVVTIEEMEFYDEGAQISGEDPRLAGFIGTPLSFEAELLNREEA